MFIRVSQESVAKNTESNSVSFKWIKQFLPALWAPVFFLLAESWFFKQAADGPDGGKGQR